MIPTGIGPILGGTRLGHHQAYSLVRERSIHNEERWEVLREWMDADLPGGGRLIEAGVHRGGVTAYMALRRPEWEIYGYDNFEGGLVGRSDTDGKLLDGLLAWPLAEVRDWLRSLNVGNVWLVPGDVRSTFELWDGDEVAFAHVDLDLYAPTLHVLRELADRVLPGGAILVDDLGFPGVDRAVAESGLRWEPRGYFAEVRF